MMNWVSVFVIVLCGAVGQHHRPDVFCRTYSTPKYTPAPLPWGGGSFYRTCIFLLDEPFSKRTMRPGTRYWERRSDSG